MPRHDYRGATPETTAALKKFIGEIAYEWGVEPAYIYAILSGKEPDPFKRFLEMFRATCRKNPEGARGFIAKLSTMLRDETPQKADSVGIGDAMRTFGDLCSTAAELDEGLCPPEKFERVKREHTEMVERVTIYPPSADMHNLGG